MIIDNEKKYYTDREILQKFSESLSLPLLNYIYTFSNTEHCIIKGDLKLHYFDEYVIYKCNTYTLKEKLNYVEPLKKDFSQIF